MSQLKEVLSELKAASNADACAIVSRNGIPIAYDIPAGTHIDTFSTLSATILGASEVIYSGMNREKPHRVLVESKDGTLLGTAIGPKALLVVLSKAPLEQIVSNVEQASVKIREVLKHGQ